MFGSSSETLNCNIFMNFDKYCRRHGKDAAARFGVDVYTKGVQLTEKEFVGKVDSFLYLAKQEGRNKVCHSTFEGEDQGGSVTKELHAESSSPNVS